MPGATLGVDRDAREIFNTAAIAAAMGDKDAALEVCRRLVALEPHYRLALRVGDDAPGAKEPAPSPENDGARPARTLRQMAAKFAGRCARCARRINEGDIIRYDATNKRAFHEECAA